MTRHRTSRKRLQNLPPHDNRRAALPAAPEPAPEVDHLIDVLRDNLRRADAFVSTAEEFIEQSWNLEADEDSEDDDGGIQRRRMRVEYLVEAGKLAVRAAQYTGDQLAAELDLHRRGA